MGRGPVQGHTSPTTNDTDPPRLRGLEGPLGPLRTFEISKHLWDRWRSQRHRATNSSAQITIGTEARVASHSVGQIRCLRRFLSIGCAGARKAPAPRSVVSHLVGDDTHRRSANRPSNQGCSTINATFP